MGLKMSFESLGNDGLAEIVDRALGEVLVNILDKNTEHKPKRKLIIEVAFQPDQGRTFPVVTYAVKVALAPVTPVAVTSMIEKDLKTGELVMILPNVGTHADQHELEIDHPKVTNIAEAKANG
jgi:hypothetical protein